MANKENLPESSQLLISILKWVAGVFSVLFAALIIWLVSEVARIDTISATVDELQRQNVKQWDVIQRLLQ